MGAILTHLTRISFHQHDAAVQDSITYIIRYFSGNVHSLMRRPAL